MTNARLSVDIAITQFRIASDSARLLSTPAEEIALALRPDPRPAGWLDPCFGTLYLVTNDANGLIRIGCADRLRKRYTDMNVTSPVQLTIAHFVHLVGMPVAKQVELDLHTTLLAYRRRGEWFEVDLEAATQEMADAIYRRRFQFWTEAERREVGAAAARCHATRSRSI
jgi:hypothetical protein